MKFFKPEDFFNNFGDELCELAANCANEKLEKESTKVQYLGKSVTLPAASGIYILNEFKICQHPKNNIIQYIESPWPKSLISNDHKIKFECGDCGKIMKPETFVEES